MDPRRLLFLFALTALAQMPSAWALSLGNARGGAFIGRPLDVQIAATHESGDPESPCVEADVFQGDNRMAPGRVTTRWESGPGGRASVRVSTDVAVEEPVVTVYLRVGCSNRVTRRYVLLAEQPVEPERGAAPRAAQRAELARVTPPPATAVVPATAMNQPVRNGDKAKSAVPAPAAKPPAPPPRAQPRLKLEPVDLEAEPQLKTSARLQNLPGEDGAARQQAAALWRALNAGPQELLHNAERIQALERDVRSLQELTQKNVAAMELMREQVQKARGERNTLAQLAAVLAVLLVLAAAASVWAWRRRGAGTTGAWWSGRRPAAETEFPSDLYAEEPSLRAPAAPAAAGAAAAGPLSDLPDIDLSFTQSSLQKLQPGAPASRPAPPPASRPAFSASRWPASDFHGYAASSRLKAEELIDIQQQADFFLSIGQTDRAIALLESHVQQAPDGSVLAWMDLLEIYHDLGRREDYERVRWAFGQRFNAQAPAFEGYRQAQAGLEHYTHTMGHIVELWPSRAVLDVIEELLLRRPDEPEAESFGLEAYRELVLLYNIAKDVAEDAPDTPNVTPLAEATVAVPAGQHPWPSARLGVDIDLAGLEGSAQDGTSDAPQLPQLPELQPPASPQAANDPPMLDFDPSAWPSGKR